MSITLDTGSTKYVWNPVQSKEGYFDVTINGSEAKLTTADMLLVVYDWLQTAQSAKVAKTAEVAALISDISLAASDIVKNIGLMNNAFDGEYYKGALAPANTIASNVGDDVVTKTDDSKESKGGYMSLDMAKEMVSAYGKMMAAYEKLTGTEYENTLSDMNLSLDNIKTYCKSYMFGVDWPDLANKSVSFTQKSIYHWVIVSGLEGDSGNDTKATLEAKVKSYKEAWETAAVDSSGKPVNLGIMTTSYSVDQNLESMDDTDNCYLSGLVGFHFASGSKKLITDEDGNIDWDDDQNKTLMALYFLNQTTVLTIPAPTTVVHTMRTNAPDSANGKESFNNCMNKYNAATQTATQYASQALSTSESRQTMIDRNISTLTDTMTSLARGY